MRDKLKITDTKGALMKSLLCIIVWYTDVIQMRYFEISNFLLFLGVLLAAILFLDYYSNRSYWKKVEPKWLLIMLGYILLTGLFGFFVSPRLSSHVSMTTTILEYYIIMFALCYYSITRENVDFFIWNYLIMYTFMTIVFIVSPQVSTQDLTFRYSFSATLNTNNFAIFLSVGIWSTLYMVSKRKIPKFMATGIVILMFYSILKTGSRKGFIVAAICIVAWYAMCYLPQKNNQNITMQIFKVLISIVVITFGYQIMSSIYQSSAVSTRMEFIFTDASSVERLNLYDLGWQYFKNSPVFGYGFGGFEILHGSTYSHSTLIEVSVSSGVFLSILYLGGYFNIWKNIRYCRNNAKMNGDSTLLLELNQALILFFMLLFNTIGISHIHYLGSFMCFGIIVSIYTIYRVKFMD